jgi:ActD protein
MKTLVATFHTPEALLRAAEKAKAEGFPPEDALTPFPIEEFEAVLGLKQASIRSPMAIAGFSAAAFAYALEWYSAALAYPYDSGARPPLNSWAVFLLFPFELGILVAGITGFIAFLIYCGLPSLYHPLFDVRGIDQATSDRFLLMVKTVWEENPEKRLREILEGEGASSISEVGP